MGQLLESGIISGEGFCGYIPGTGLFRSSSGDYADDDEFGTYQGFSNTIYQLSEGELDRVISIEDRTYDYPGDGRTSYYDATHDKEITKEGKEELLNEYFYSKGSTADMRRLSTKRFADKLRQ